MAFSEDFLKKYAKIAQQNQQAAMIAGASDSLTELKLKKKKGGAHTGTKMSHWNYTMPNDVNVIVYDPRTGMAFPSPSHARAYGLTRFVYNLPPGMKVNWSQWQKYAQPETPPTPVVETTVADQTLPFEPEPASPNVYPTAQPQPQPEPEPSPVVQPEAAPIVKRREAPPPPPPKPYTPVDIASRDKWENQGTYMHGNSSARSVADNKDAESLKGDKNNDAYYDNYVSEMKKANENKNAAKANEINRAHSLNKKGQAQAKKIIQVRTDNRSR